MAVPGGRDIASAINELLSLPYTLKIATKDFHPLNHVSFAKSHPPPDNVPFQSSVLITNPSNPQITQRIPLWPIHCVQGTKGAEIIPEIDQSKFDMIIEKGMEQGNEMFSVFGDVFGNKSKGARLELAAILKDHDINRVDVVGLAGDFCVRATALDAKKEGFEVSVVEGCIRCVNTEAHTWQSILEDFQGAGIKTVSMNKL